MKKEYQQLITDDETLRRFQKDIATVHKGLSEEASVFQARWRISGDAEQAEIAKYYVCACEATSKLNDLIKDKNFLADLIQERRKAIPGRWSRFWGWFFRHNSKPKQLEPVQEVS